MGRGDLRRCRRCVTLALATAVVVGWPADRFKGEGPTDVGRDRHVVVRALASWARNLAGAVLVVLGAHHGAPGRAGAGAAHRAHRPHAAQLSGQAAARAAASSASRRVLARASTACARASRAHRWSSTDGHRRNLRAAGDRLRAVERSPPRGQLAHPRLGLRAAVRDGAVRAADARRRPPLHRSPTIWPTPSSGSPTPASASCSATGRRRPSCRRRCAGGGGGFRPVDGRASCWR